MYNNLRQKSIPVRDDRKLQPRADARAKQKGGIMEIKTNEKKFSTRTLTVTAMFLAMNIIMSSSMLSVPVPGGHIYLNNAIITIASILLNPLCAFIVGGIGAFIGDLLFYPAPMFVSLVTHGIQAIVVSLCARKLFLFALLAHNHRNCQNILGKLPKLLRRGKAEGRLLDRLQELFVLRGKGGNRRPDFG